MGSICGQTFTTLSSLAFTRAWLSTPCSSMENCATVKKGATKHCSWGTCKSDSRFKQKLPEGTGFVRFAKPGKLKDGLTDWEKNRELEKTAKAKRWLHACGRKDFCELSQIKKDTYICTLHFVGGNGPTEDHPDPILATLSEAEREKRAAYARKRAKSSARNRNGNHRPGFPVKKPRLESLERDLEDNNSNIVGDEDEPSACFDDKSPITSFQIVSSKEYADKETQTVLCKYTLGAKVEAMVYKNQLIRDGVSLGTHEPQEKNIMSYDTIMKDQKKCRYFTGLDPQQFEALFGFLGEAKYELKYWDGSSNGDETHSKRNGVPRNVSVEQQLFITLLRLRRGFNVATISHIYGLSETVVRKIFVTWIQFLFHHFKEYKYLMFPKRETLHQYLPNVFKGFRRVRCSVDCTEFYCQTPSDYGQQGNMFSSYKHHNTMKCLIAVTPNGSACFVSDLFEGGIDDVSIFRECGILEHIEPFDTLLVDKGFTVQDLLLRKQASIYIPPFLGKRDHFTKEEEIMTKKIARARIHVERFNERLKKFRLIGKILPLTLIPMASQLVYVAACLVNFQPCLCK